MLSDSNLQQNAFGRLDAFQTAFACCFGWVGFGFVWQEVGIIAHKGNQYSRYLNVH